MPITPDHRPGVSGYEDLQTQYADNASAYPTVAGAQAYGNGTFRFQDALGVYDPRFVYQLSHTALYDMAHAGTDGPVLNGAYLVTSYAAGTPFVSALTWYTSSAQTTKILDRTLTYPSGSYLTPTTDRWRLFAADGSVLRTLTDTIVYSGINEVARTRTVS